MDWVVASIIDELKESGLLDNTLVVITNDHGEMLGGKEDGQIGHGWVITPQLANTPLIIMDPARQGLQVNTNIGTQVDFLPTVLDRLNIPLPSDQLYEGHSLDDHTGRQGQLAYLNSYKQFGIVEGDKILLGDRESKNAAGVASRGAAFKISNDGAKTLFTETEEAKGVIDRASTMARFDEFQENFLRNYAAYCRSVHGQALQFAKKTGN
jgi:membrane-anchored protein YejM (alkaline phosphatase superfamily)